MRQHRSPGGLNKGTSKSWRPFIPGLGDHYDLTTRIVSEAKVVSEKQGGFAWEQKVSDLEHLVLNLRHQLQTKSPSKTKLEFDQIKRLLKELERNIKKAN